MDTALAWETGYQAGLTGMPIPMMDCQEDQDACEEGYNDGEAIYISNLKYES